MKRIIVEDVDRLLVERRDLRLLNHQTVLISGADSFLMSYLVYLILENNRRNHCETKILALCRNRGNAERRFQTYLEDPNLNIIVHDVRTPFTWRGDIDVCIHAASPVGVPSRQEQALEAFQTNLFGCQNLLELAYEKQVRKFMLISSIDVYGECQLKGRRKETDVGILDWSSMRNAYPCGKRAAEALCSFYHTLRGMPCVTARPSQVYGPGVPLTDGRLHGDFIRQLQEKSEIVLKSDGSAVRSFVYLLDATHALLDILFYGNPGGRYNICDEAGECSVRELAELYVAYWKNGAKVTMSYEERDTLEVKGALSTVTGDSSQLRELGWKSRTTLKEGIVRTLEFYAGECPADNLLG